MARRAITAAALIAALLVPARALAQESTGQLDPVAVSDGIATIAGTAPEGASLHIYIDNEFAGSVEAEPDFELTTPALPGTHQVCAYVLGSAAEDNTLLGCDDYEVAAAASGPWLALSSDFHVSTPGGRWQSNDERLEAFISELNGYETPPEVLVVAGDMVDNVSVDLAGTPKSGTIDRWQADVARYQQILSGLNQIPTVHALGPGHDVGGTVGADQAQEAFGSGRGYLDWEAGRLIWLDSSPTPAEVLWLDRVLTNMPGDAVLVFHVPVSTPATENLDHDRVLVADNGLYELIQRHADSLDAIVNGHIHTASASRLNGVPVHLCPLIDSGSYCRLVATDHGAVVEHAQLRPWQ